MDIINQRLHALRARLPPGSDNSFYRDLADRWERLYVEARDGNHAPSLGTPDPSRGLNLVFCVFCLQCKAKLHPYNARTDQTPVDDAVAIFEHHLLYEPHQERVYFTLAFCVLVYLCVDLVVCAGLSWWGLFAVARFVVGMQQTMLQMWWLRWRGTYRCHVCHPSSNMLDRVAHWLVRPYGTGREQFV